MADDSTYRQLLDMLQISHTKEMQKEPDGFTPMIASDERFSSGNYKKVGNVEGFLTDIIADLIGAEAATNKLTGKIYVTQETLGRSDDPYDGGADKIEALLHENFHSRYSKIPSSVKSDMDKKSVEMFGSRKEYNRVVDALTPEHNKKSVIYKIQDILLGYGLEETLSYITGRAGARNSVDTMKPAFEKLHPRAWEWFEMQLDAVHKTTKAPKADKLK